MTVTIGDAIDREIEAVTALSVTAYREYARALTAENWKIMRHNISNLAAIDRGQLIVARQDASGERLYQSGLVGAVVYCPPGTSDSRLFLPEWASIRMLAVSPPHRGQGIGAQLCLECIDRAKQDKADIIGLHTSELMESAMRMYERLGFTQEIELPSRLGLKYWRYVLKLAQ